MNNIKHGCLCFRISYKRNTHANPSTCKVLAHILGFCLLVRLDFVTYRTQDRQLRQSVPWSAASKRQGCGERHFHYSEREQSASVGRARTKTHLQDKVSSDLPLETHSPRNKKFLIKSPCKHTGQSGFSYCTSVWRKQESKFLLKSVMS